MEVRMIIRTALFFMVFLVMAMAGEPAPYTLIKTDASALLSFKKMIVKDPNGVLVDWKLNKDPCKWNGIACTFGRVSDVDLTQSSLVGQVSFYPFSSLDMLTSLNLFATSLSINASTSLVQIPYGLKQLELSFAGVLDHIAENLFTNCPNLEYLNLAFNNITGSLPELISCSGQLYTKSSPKNLIRLMIMSETTRQTAATAGQDETPASI